MTRYIFIGLLLIMFTSCGEEFFSAPIEFDLDEFEPQVSVVGRLTSYESLDFIDIENINNISFFISRSKSVIDTASFDVIDNAQVSVTDSDGTEVEYFFDEDSGYYFPANIGTPDVDLIVVKGNTEYSLVVEIPGEELVTASISTSTFGELASAEIKLNDIKADNNFTLDRLTLDINDPQGKNYYYLRTFYKTNRIGSDGEVYQEQTQGYIYNVSSVLDSEASLFTDELFDGQEISLEFWSERYIGRFSEVEGQVDPETIIINLWTLTEEEYNFRESLRKNNEAVDNPFAEPTVVFSNIENGIGVFSLTNVQSLEIKL